MRKFIPLLIMIMFTPLTIYAQNNDVEPTTEDIIDLKTRIESDEKQIELLQNQINDMKIRLTESEKQKDLSEKFNQLLLYLNRTENNLKLKEDIKWKQGDVLVGSATIVALFGLGSFLTIRFQGFGFLKKKLTALRGIFALIGTIEAFHLTMIILVISNEFSIFAYSMTMGVTIGGLFLIFYLMYQIIYMEHDSSIADKIRSLVRKRTKQGE